MTARARHVSLAAAACLLLIAGVAAAATIGSLRTDPPATTRIVADGATLALGDDDGGGALFTLPAAKPGESVTRCIRITYDGSPGQAVRLSAVAQGAGTLAPFIDVDIDAGSGGGFAGCAGFSGTRIYHGTLADLQTNHPDYDRGLTGFVPSAAEPAKTFRITVQVRDTNTAQGQAAGVTFAWTAVDGSTPPPPPPVPTTDTPPPPGPAPTDTPPIDLAAVPTETTTAPPTQTATTPATSPAPPRTPQSPPIQPTHGGPVAPHRPQPVPDAPTSAPAAGTGAGIAEPAAGGSGPERTGGGANGQPSSPSRRSNRPRSGAPGSAGAGRLPGGQASAPRGGEESDGLLQRVLGQKISETVDKVVTAVAEAAGPVAERSAFPVVLLLVMVLFLFVQNRIDGRDPKLALAPLRSDDLSFSDDVSDDKGQTP